MWVFVNELIIKVLVKRYLVILLFVLKIMHPVGAQDAQFSQFYAAPLYLASAFTGATEENRITMNYRNQWPALPGVFTTYSFSYDRYFHNFNSGIGFLALYDVAGSGHLSTLNMGLLYSYNIQVNDYIYVRPGIQVKYAQLALDFYRLIFNDQLSPGGNTPPTEQPPFDNIGDIDAETSVLAYTERLWLGTSVDHLFRPKASLYGDETKIPIKVSVFGGAQIIRKGRLLKPIEESLSLAFLFKTQGRFKQLDMGLYWYKAPLMFGFWYRGIPIPMGKGYNSRDAMIVLVGYKTKQLQVGYSYDFTVSRLLMDTGGAHEISFMYEFKTTQYKRRKIHAIPCPEF